MNCPIGSFFRKKNEPFLFLDTKKQQSAMMSKANVSNFYYNIRVLRNKSGAWLKKKGENMKRRIISTILAVSLCASMLMGCGGKQEPAAENTPGTEDATDSQGEEETEGASDSQGEGEDGDGETQAEWDEAPAEVTWLLWNVGGNCNEEGVQSVEDALNEITLNKINVKVDLQVLDMGTYMSQMPMQVSSGDKIDLITTFPAGAGSYQAMQASKQLLPLKALLEDYAPETLEVFPEKVLKSTSEGEEIYALPALTDYSNDGYWVCRQSYLDSGNVDMANIKTMTDLTDAFAKMYEANPGMKMISSGAQNLANSSGAMVSGVAYDSLGSEFIAVMVDKDPTKVVSYFETDEFKETFKLLQEWYQAGYIDKDVATRTDDPTVDTSVGSVFLGGNIVRVAGGDVLAGEPRQRVKLVEGYIGTSTIAIMNMAVPTSATEPEAAVKLMNLCYTDKDVKMLVSYGIKDKDYKITDGGVELIASANYAPNTYGIFGNTLICDPADVEVQTGQYIADVDLESLKYSPLLGFRINSDPITQEQAALDTVFAEFKGMVMTGSCDDTVYEDFIKKLYDNGLQKYIDEVQTQLDTWYEAQ